jgi:hypothetical protein
MRLVHKEAPSGAFFIASVLIRSGAFWRFAPVLA